MLCVEKVLDIRGLSRTWEYMSWEHNRGDGSFCSPWMCLTKKRVMDLKRSIYRRPRGVGNNDPLYELKRGFAAAELEGNLGGGAENFLWKSMGFHPMHSEFSESQALCSIFHACLLFRYHVGTRQRRALRRCKAHTKLERSLKTFFSPLLGFHLMQSTSTTTLVAMTL